jgi:DNA-directed RNA polymerase specialized sigma24 family protein
MATAPVAPVEVRNAALLEVRRYMYHLAKHAAPPGLVDDIVQEAVVYFLTGYDPTRVAHPAAFAKICLRQCIRRARERQRVDANKQRRYAERMADYRPLPSTPPGVHDERLCKALAAEPPDIQRLIVGRFGLTGEDEKTHLELAAGRGCHQAVSDRIRRALNRLAARIGPPT